MSYARSYSPIDRALHHVAFSLPFVQRSLAELEADMYRRELESVTSREEVFVTGLPRAGTTLVLELLFATGEFATFTYRDMPFILSPLLWQRFSRSSRKQGALAERSHGDGVEISYDSAEAFEEVAWLAYLGDRIVHERTLAPISAGDVSPEAAAALQLFVRKRLLASAREAGGSPLRYLSKNNANISRLDALASLFPTARALVVFREPLAQVTSLMAAHRRFLDEHAKDKFSERYMRWIGHYDFGANFRPIDFDGRLGRDGHPKVVDASFWLEYWIAAYRSALEAGGSQVRLVDFEYLCRDPKAALERLAGDASVKDPARLLSFASRLRAPTSHPVAASTVDSRVLKTAQEVHAALRDAMERGSRDSRAAARAGV
jgi:hypothetical protein